MKKFCSNDVILKFSIITAKFFKSIPICITAKAHYNHVTYTVSAVDSKYWLRLKYKTFVAKLLLGILFLQCIQASLHPSVTRHYEFVISWFSFCVLTTATYHLHELQQKSDVLITYLTSIFHLQRRISTITRYRVWSLNEMLNRIFALMTLCTGFVYSPVFLLGFHYSNPCQASLIGHQLMMDCKADANLSTETYQYIRRGVEKPIVLLLNIWVWYFTMNATVFAAAVVMIICPIIFRDATLV